MINKINFNINAIYLSLLLFIPSNYLLTVSLSNHSCINVHAVYHLSIHLYVHPFIHLFSHNPSFCLSFVSLHPSIHLSISASVHIHHPSTHSLGLIFVVLVVMVSSLLWKLEMSSAKRLSYSCTIWWQLVLTTVR